MLNFRILSAGALLLSLLHFSATAQDLGNSPYSRYGLGDLSPVGFLRNSGMAGVGVASSSSFHINELNPALLLYNQQVTFEIAASSQLKRIENATTSQQDGNTTLRYLAFAFPVNQKWTTSIGLKPYSSVSYKIVTETPVTGDTATKARFLYQGSGGINEVYWANGVRLAKGLSVGLHASYLFGSLNNETVSQVLTLNDVPQGNLVSLKDRRTLKDISLKGGLAYRTKVADNLNLGLGLTYQYLFGFNSKQLRTNTTLVQVTGGTVVGTLDTLETSSDEREITVPQPLQAGISLDNGKNWMIGLDYQTQDWSDFGAFGEPAGTLARSYRVALGGEITPDPGSVTSYFKRITYRAGISAGQTPIRVRNEQLNEQQASFGITLPTGRTGSVLNMAFVTGRRGTTDNGLIKETFYRFELGLSLSDRWFQRRQIE